MADEVKTLSSQLAQDPDSLVFLRLGELLRKKGQFDAADRVELTGIERHTHLADANGGRACQAGARGRDVTGAGPSNRAGVSHEAARRAKLLGLVRGTGVAPEGQHGHVHLTPPAGDALLLVVRDRAVPMGRLAIIAQRAAGAARRWLEQQA